MRAVTWNRTRAFRHLDGTTVHLAVTYDIQQERKRAEGATFLLSAIVDYSDDAIISKNL